MQKRGQFAARARFAARFVNCFKNNAPDPQPEHRNASDKTSHFENKRLTVKTASPRRAASLLRLAAAFIAVLHNSIAP
jgi:hypothetical protein